MGNLELLNTPSGKIAMELVSAGIPLGISSRGMGSVKQLGETVEVQDDYIDKKLVTKKYNNIVNKVNDIILSYKETEDYNDIIDRIEKLKDKIKKMRQAGLEDKGEYSTENIVFKFLRRNGIMEKVNNLLVKSYDKSMTIDEELCKNIEESEINL